MNQAAMMHANPASNLQAMYRHCLRASGWLPLAAWRGKMQAGLLFQLQNGRIAPLLHSVELLPDELRLSPHMSLPEIALQEDVEQCMAGSLTPQESGGEHVCTRQEWRFSQAGGHVLLARELQAQMLLDWARLKPVLTLKLCQQLFSLRHVYICSGVAHSRHWLGAAAARAGAELSFEQHSETADACDLLQSAKRWQSNALAWFGQGPQELQFFRVQRLGPSAHAQDQLLRRIGSAENGIGAWSGAWLHSDPCDILRANELNLNNVNEYFDWQDANAELASAML